MNQLNSLMGPIRGRTNKTEVELTTEKLESSEPVKIVVVADTHMPRMAKALPPTLTEELKDADLILHAGDWTSPDIYDLFAVYAPIYGVAGNNDGAAIAEHWGYRRIVEIAGWQIGLTHGHLGRGGGTQANAAAAFEGEEVDMIVFGHSHIPFLSHDTMISEDRKVSLFNPGSPTDKRWQKRYSFGIITLNGMLVSFEHRYYDSKI
ncbi:metallophosphoesterase family protein [Saccharibacillus kuerlensis]|uniref:Phosphoesterase n=1 Tax=Saccharibacillus kuerlensis TaxID=459527 RepID=A0ABQ2L3M4_9BACL|nr:metallophosphoesterase [Saccharibacillus kuerlensis]GGO01420.1 phosphoesterase [Saccharibacillus kuerlensis]